MPRPDDCPCQSAALNPGPHIAECPWSDPDHDPYGPPPAEMARAVMMSFAPAGMALRDHAILPVAPRAQVQAGQFVGVSGTGCAVPIGSARHESAMELAAMALAAIRESPLAARHELRELTVLVHSSRMERLGVERLDVAGLEVLGDAWLAADQVAVMLRQDEPGRKRREFLQSADYARGARDDLPEPT